MNFNERLEGNVRRLPPVAKGEGRQVATVRLTRGMYRRAINAAHESRASLNAFMVTAIEVAIDEVERNSAAKGSDA